MTRTGAPLAISALLLTSLGLGVPTALAAQSRPDWGTQDRILSHVAFSEFVSCCANVPITCTGTPVSALGCYSPQGGAVLYAVPHVPSGALLTYLELDFCDTSFAGKHVGLRLLDCDSLTVTCAAAPLLDLSSSTALPGCGKISADLSSLNYTMDNGARQLILVGTTEASDQTNTLNGAYVGYKLQVSTAPATATFADVPASHPYFRAIEALASSGVTQGCGGGNYCPNQPVTRGEMAKFLANALGLHFSN